MSEDWIRKDVALADAFSLQHAGVDRTCLGLQFIEVVQRRWRPRSLGALTMVSPADKTVMSTWWRRLSLGHPDGEA